MINKIRLLNYLLFYSSRNVCISSEAKYKCCDGFCPRKQTKKTIKDAEFHICAHTLHSRPRGACAQSASE